MNILSFSEFENKKLDFIKKHKGLQKVITGEFEEGKYRKRYICEDGKELIEINRKVTKMATASIYNVKIDVPIELFESEMWNDDDSTSCYSYQKF